MDYQKRKKSTATMKESEINNSALTKNQQPLLNSLIVKTILEFCKFNSEDKAFFASLRLVCKIWDAECGRILRKETEIQIPRLLEPYPNGLGWEEYRCDRFSGFEHHYNCPFPTTREFENFQFTATCESFKDRNVHRWFSVMGEQVKSLHFICPLTCFHQNDYLAKILNKWCPNLETLHLDGIQCFSSLIYIFEGRSDRFRSASAENCAIICGRLKNLTISVESDDTRKDCKVTIDEILPGNSNMDMNILKTLMTDFKELIDLLPKKDLAFRPEMSHLFHQLIESSDPETLSNILKAYIQNIEVDWGILGQILKTAPVQKLVIKKLDNARQTQDLVIFLLTQPSKLQSSLEHLEFQSARLSRFCLKALSLFKCSLSTFRLDKILWRKNAAKHLHDILKNSAESLTNFEVALENIIYQHGDSDLMNFLQIPHLPKLKSFTNKRMDLLHVNGLDLLRNAPNLETCCIEHLPDGMTPQMTSKALKNMCGNLDDPSVVDHPLKELKINVVLEKRHVTLLSKGLPNLMKVELITNSLMGFILGYNNGGEWEKLNSLILTSEGEFNRKNKVAGNTRDEEIAKCFDRLKSLKFFEITFDSYELGKLETSTFANGFTKLRQLASLKINNMCISPDKKEEIHRNLAHIPFVSVSKPPDFSPEEFFNKIKTWQIKQIRKRKARATF